MSASARQLTQEPVDGGCFVFNFHAQARGFERQAGRNRRQERREADAVFFSCDQSCGAGSARGIEDAVDVVLHVALMIGESDAAGHVEACAFKTGKELIGARDTAKGDYGAIDLWHLHTAMKTPDRALPKTAPDEFLLDERCIGHGESNHSRAPHCIERLTQIAGRQQAILEIGDGQ